MTPEEFVDKMVEIYGYDYDEEDAHLQADKLMCELLRSLGYEAGVEIFEAADKWYA